MNATATSPTKPTEYGKSKSVYPTNHNGSSILPFIAKTFRRDGVNCFYGVQRDNFSTSYSNIKLEELREINKGNSITRIVKSTQKSYSWDPIPIANTDTIEVSMEAVGNLYCIDIDDFEIIDGKKCGNYIYDNLPEFLKACPYTKSRNKGNPHLWFRIDGIDADKLKGSSDWKNGNENLNFPINTSGELLTRMTWEYKHGEVFNWNGDIPTFEWDLIKTIIKEKEIKNFEKKLNLNVKQPPTIIEYCEESKSAPLTEQKNEKKKEKEKEK